MLQKIDHINVVVSDLASARDFFCRLGFVVTHAGDLKGEWISAIVGLPDVQASYVQLALGETDCRLELLAFDNPPSPPVSRKNQPHQIGIRHMAFAVDDIETLVAGLRDDDIAFFSECKPTRPPARSWFTAMDRMASFLSLPSMVPRPKSGALVPPIFAAGTNPPGRGASSPTTGEKKDYLESPPARLRRSPSTVLT